jgi:hypothetical protein
MKTLLAVALMVVGAWALGPRDRGEIVLALGIGLPLGKVKP